MSVFSFKKEYFRKKLKTSFALGVNTTPKKLYYTGITNNSSKENCQKVKAANRKISYWYVFQSRRK